MAMGMRNKKALITYLTHWAFKIDYLVLLVSILACNLVNDHKRAAHIWYVKE